MSGTALFDAATMAVTGHYSVFSDDSTVPWLLHTSNVVHGLAYVALVAVLLQHRHRIEQVNRTAGVLFWVVLASLLVLAAGFLLLQPFLDPQDMPAAPGAAIGLAFAGMLLGAPVLGTAVRRVPAAASGQSGADGDGPSSLESRSCWGSWHPRSPTPAYMETALAFGVALLGYRAAQGTWTRE